MSREEPNPRARNRAFRSWPQACMARSHAKNIRWRMTLKTDGGSDIGFPTDFAGSYQRRKNGSAGIGGGWGAIDTGGWIASMNTKLPPLR